MDNNIDILKANIKKFVSENIGQSIFVSDNRGEDFHVNKAIFEIESYLVELRNTEKYKINNRLDSSIASANILANFKNLKSDNAYKPVEFQYHFLYHLAEIYEPGKDLHLIIDEFITKHKEQFSPADIVITASGATRCKTNIRFTLGNLRNFCLVISRDKRDKRSWCPSILGLVALLNIEVCKPESKSWSNYREHDSLFFPNTSYKPSLGNAAIDPLISYSLKQFDNPGYILAYLNRQREISLTEKEKKLLTTLIKKYMDYVFKGLNLNKSSAKEKEQYNKRSKQFQRELFNMQNENNQLLEKLFAHFRQNKQKSLFDQ